VQQAQHKIFQAQQQSINDPKKIIVLLLEKPKKKTKSPKTKASSSKSKGKEKEGENFTSANTNNENNFRYENPEFSSEEKENFEDEDNHVKRMNELEKCLEAIAN